MFGRRASCPLYLLCFLDFVRPCSILAAQEAGSLVNQIKILCETLVHSIMLYRHWQLPIQFMTSTSSSRVEWTALSTRTAGWRELKAGGMRNPEGKVMCTYSPAHGCIFNSHTWFILSWVPELIINAPHIGLKLSGSLTSAWVKKRAVAMRYIFRANAIYRPVSPWERRRVHAWPLSFNPRLWICGIVLHI